MKNINFSILLIFIALSSFSQVKQGNFEVKGDFEFPLDSKLSIEENKSKYLQIAQLKLIEDKFGRTLVQGNTLSINTNTVGDFTTNSDSYVKGEWIKDLKDPVYKIFSKNNIDWIQISISGVIRENSNDDISLNYKLINCSDNLNCETSTFKVGDKFFVKFISPIRGYLALYLLVPNDNKAYKCLPYKNSINNEYYEILADKEYTFFKPDKKSAEPVDELICYTSEDKKSELNQLYFIFSPNEDISKPILTVNNNLTSSNLKIPNNVNSSDFKKWLQTLRALKDNIIVRSTFFTISKM